MVLGFSVTFFIVPTSQHWYLTVDHVTHLALVHSYITKDGCNRSGDFSQYSWGLSGTQVEWMLKGNGVTYSPGKMATNIHSCSCVYL